MKAIKIFRFPYYQIAKRLNKNGDLYNILDIILISKSFLMLKRENGFWEKYIECSKVLYIRGDY